MERAETETADDGDRTVAVVAAEMKGSELLEAALGRPTDRSRENARVERARQKGEAGLTCRTGGRCLGIRKGPRSAAMQIV